MNDFLEDKEFEEHRKRHAERMERMRREKEQYERITKLVKKVAPLVLGFIALLAVAVAGSGNDAGKEVETELQTETEMPVTETELPTETEIVVEEGPKYEFVETADTIDITTEKVISGNAILVDATNNTIIAGRGAKERISPASMTKVLTVLVAAEHITEEQLDDTFTMTLEITDYSYVNDCSCVGFLKDEVIPVRDLFYGTILPSGADAAVGLATYVAGSHEAFVELMNEKLEELGLSESAHFTNCVGLYSKEHYCTVYDMAVIMKAAMDNELCREVLTTKYYVTTPTELHPEGLGISNWFLRRIEDKDTGGEVIGGKTGYVVQSRSCAVSYGVMENGNAYICATAGSSGSKNCINDHVAIYTGYVPEIDSPESVE